MAKILLQIISTLFHMLDHYLQKLKLILMVFEWVSCLKINLPKGTLLGINLNQDSVSLLNCGVSKWPITSSGLPLEGIEYHRILHRISYGLTLSFIVYCSLSFCTLCCFLFSVFLLYINR